MVKTHLTSAVNEEIVTLKNQIKQLKETCTRLEQENILLKQYATPDTLKLIEAQRIQTNSSLTSLPPQVIQAASSLNAPSATSLNPVTFELGYANPGAESSEMMNPVVSTAEHMTASFTEQPPTGYINLTPDQVNSAVDKEVNN